MPLADVPLTGRVLVINVEVVPCQETVEGEAFGELRETDDEAEFLQLAGPRVEGELLELDWTRDVHRGELVGHKLKGLIGHSGILSMRTLFAVGPGAPFLAGIVRRACVVDHPKIGRRFRAVNRPAIFFARPARGQACKAMWFDSRRRDFGEQRMSRQ